MDIHNNKVGRRIVASNLLRECKCHGVSGSCAMKTCWKTTPKLEDVAELLHHKYLFASKVRFIYISYC